ncbi:hypothetical protein ACNKHR_01965 [Shigella flexneri]
MSAGNTLDEAHVQGLSEVFELYIKTALLLKASASPRFRRRDARYRQ